MRQPKQAVAALALLLAAALAPGLAEGRRGLVQGGGAADAPPAAAAANGSPPQQESIYGSPIVDQCIQLTNSAGAACTVESDTLSLVYSRGSEQLPTPEEISTAITNMKSAAQPSNNCCKELLLYADARCPCDPGYQQLLPIGGYDPAYFEGATAILVEACGHTWSPCQPGEQAKPGGRR